MSGKVSTSKLLSTAASRKTTRKREVERMAREVLTNPVIEEFRFSLED